MSKRIAFKKIINMAVSLTVFVIVIMTFKVTVFAGETDAEDLTKKTSIAISGGGDSAFLKDQSFYTKNTFNGSTTITISNESGIKGIYVIWEQVPGEWQLDVNGASQTCGKNGFIHEFIELSEITKSAVIHMPSAGAIIADISTFGPGKIPSWVQVWKTPYDKADMVLMPTHADDEHLFFGGTMPYYAGELGLKVQVVYLTNHWGEYFRPHELLNGLWEVGVTAYPVIGPFKDIYSTSFEHAKTLFPMESVIGFETEIIRRFKPKVMIAQDFKGEYGHGVHMLNSYAMAQALEISNDPNSYPESAAKYGVWDVPKTYVHLYEKEQLTMNWDVKLDSFDGATAFDMTVRGFAKHRSQNGYFKVGREGVFNCMLFGLYRSTVGQDINKNDFFENVKIFRSYTYVRKTGIIPFDVQADNSEKAESGVIKKAAVNSAR